MKPFNFFLIAIGFVVSFVFLLIFVVFGFLFSAMRTGFEVGVGLFAKMDDQVKKFMTVK
jgi:hypothetical protein